MASHAELELAVAHVLPAVNLRPEGLAIPDGFVARALRRGKPATLALTGVDKQLVYVPAIDEPDLTTAAERAARSAVGAMSEAARAACTQLIAAWTDREGTTRAVAFDVGAADGSFTPLAFSWVTPDRWPEPMIDASRSDDLLLDEMLERVAHVIAGRRSGEDFGAEFGRATRLVDLQFLHRGGEGQSVQIRPDADAPDTRWDAWFERYARSAHDEWRRTGGREAGLDVREPVADGPLAGMQVFLSYARPDATSIAWPVRDALGTVGASVWFDQERTPDEELLDAGLGEVIAACDAFVMCATDEFIERAGYATQEIAWALKSGASRARELRSVVVVAAGTVLPTLITGWPRVPVESPDLAERLADALQAPAARIRDLPPNAQASAPPVLALVADLTAMRVRVAHVRRFDEVPAADVTELAAGRGNHLLLLRRRLIDVGAGLDWSGTLADVDDWPADPMIKDLRWRLAGDRAVVGARVALTGDWKDSPAVSADARHLALEPVPIPYWPVAAGWGDDERRFALRHHAGRLRLLEQLVKRGLCIGLVLGPDSVPDSVLETWAAGLVERRRECLDALIALRLDGRLSWAGDPPTWDKLFHAWHDLVTDLPPTVRPGPRAVLRVAADDLAAVAAETTWWTASQGGPALQSFTVPVLTPQTRIDVFAVPAGHPEPGSVGGRRVRLGLVGDGSSRAAVSISWSGFDDDPATGAAGMAAPELLTQAVAWRSRATSSGVHRSGLI